MSTSDHNDDVFDPDPEMPTSQLVLSGLLITASMLTPVLVFLAIRHVPFAAHMFLDTGLPILALLFLAALVVPGLTFALHRIAGNKSAFPLFLFATAVFGILILDQVNPYTRGIESVGVLAERLPAGHPLIAEVHEKVSAGELLKANRLVMDNWNETALENVLLLKTVANAMTPDDPVGVDIRVALDSGYIGKGTYKALLYRAIFESDLRHQNPDALAFYWSGKGGDADD